jgi:DNA mismatch repair protein MutH
VREPPDDLEELRVRAEALAGHRVEDLARALGQSVTLGRQTARKGFVGQWVEKALGASAGCAQVPDFPALGVELKTIPVDANGQPRESTFVTSFSLANAEHATWQTSAVRHKLRHVLFVPVVFDAGGARARSHQTAVFARPVFWQPTPAQEQILRADFDDIMGMVAVGRVEDLTARVGRWLQARPKAAHSGVRTRAYGADDEPLSAVPRGFYLRARVTAELLSNPSTLRFAD